MKIDIQKYLELRQRITDNRRGYALYSLTNPDEATYTEYELDYSKGATYTCSDLDNHVEGLKTCWRRVYHSSKTLFQARRILGANVNFGFAKEKF